MTTNHDSAPFQLRDQIQLLLTYGVDDNTRLPISQLAAATGISDQTWLNLLKGKSTNPRLKTLLALCQYFGVSLDYFDCLSEAACRAHLYTYRLRERSPYIVSIEQASNRLSPQGQRNVLAIMEWMRRAVRALPNPLS